VGAAAAAVECAVAGKEQNAAIAVLDHRRDDRLRQIERTVKDHSPDMLPVLHRHLGEGFVRPDRGIVDQDVDAAELGQCPLRQGVDLVLLCDIGEDRYRFDAAVADLAGDRVGLGLVGAGVDDDMRAFTREL